MKTIIFFKNHDSWTELQMDEKILTFIHVKNKNISYNLCRNYFKLILYVPKCILINK